MKKSEIRVAVTLAKQGVELESIKKSVPQLTDEQIKKIASHKNSFDVVDESLVTELYDSLFPKSTTPIKIIVKAANTESPISKVSFLTDGRRLACRRHWL